MDELVTLRRALERARENGWPKGREVLRTMSFGYPVDEAHIARQLCCSEDFARAFWQEQPEKHLLGMRLVENPSSYSGLFLE